MKLLPVFEAADEVRSICMNWRIKHKKDKYCGSCEQFRKPDECKDRAVVYPESLACEFYKKRGMLDWIFSKDA